MANQHDKGRPSRAIAEQPTHSVPLDRVASASSRLPSEDDDGPTLVAKGDRAASISPVRTDAPRMAPSRDGSHTQSGSFLVEPVVDKTRSFEELPALSRRVDAPTRAIDVELHEGHNLMTNSLAYDDSLGAPSADDWVGGDYRVKSMLAEHDGSRVYLAAAQDGRQVAIRTYLDPGGIRGRAGWQTLFEAFEDGAALPELLRAPGVVPMLDLLDDLRFGPAVVVAHLGGGTLAEHAHSMSVAQVAASFEAVAAVLMRAHAQGVTVGRFTAADIALDELGQAHIDLTVAAFADALDARTVGQTGAAAAPSPAGDIWWLGQAMQACLPRNALEPGADVVAAVAHDCQEAEPRLTAADVYSRLQAVRPRPRPAERPRWPAFVLLAFGIVAALGAGWVAGGGLSSRTPVAVGTSPRSASPDIDKRLAEAEAAQAVGAWLEAGQIYRRLLVTSEDPRVQGAWTKLERQRAFRRALKDLKKRLASADEITPAVRKDVEMLRVLQPDSLVLKHWLGRMAGGPGEEP